MFCAKCHRINYSKNNMLIILFIFKMLTFLWGLQPPLMRWLGLIGKFILICNFTGCVFEFATNVVYLAALLSALKTLAGPDSFTNNGVSETIVLWILYYIAGIVMTTSVQSFLRIVSHIIRNDTCWIFDMIIYITKMVQTIE